MIYEPYVYQQFGMDHVLDNKFCGLLLEMSLGKTVITLSAIEHLMNKELEVEKVLVIAPKRVAEIVWMDEQQKWDHLHHLKLSVVAGSEKQRLAALKKKADIYLIGRDNVAWLVRHYMTKFPFDMVVIDESSSFKSPKAIRFKALRMVRPRISRLVILTGTPAPNGLMDLWPQMYLVDQGERLGKHIGDYRAEYFKPGKRNAQVVFNYEPTKNAEERIYKRISDVCVSMKTRDYIQIPEMKVNDIKVVLDSAEQQKYDDFERDQILKLIDDHEISALNAAALTTKLLQYANGAIYDENRLVHEVHTRKLDALEELIEAAQHKPMLVAYSYKHDIDRILRRFKFARELKTKEDIEKWNKKQIEVAVVHPASMGHGLNLQSGGSIVTWFGLTWSLELYDQLNARVHRQGQTDDFVLINRIICSKTMDQDVTSAIQRKAKGQNALMEAIKARIRKYNL